jgi:hypothetical protein
MGEGGGRHGGSKIIFCKFFSAKGIVTFSVISEILISHRIHPGLNVVYQGIKREIGNLPIGVPSPARIVAIKRVKSRLVFETWFPDRANPVVFEMSHSIANLHQL